MSQVTNAVVAAAATGPVVIRTSGRSMLPTLHEHQSVTIQAGSIRFGEVGAFVDGNGAVVVHRFVGRIGGRSIFLGDNNPLFDAPTSRVIGPVIAVDSGPPPTRRCFAMAVRTLRLLPRAARAHRRQAKAER